MLTKTISLSSSKIAGKKKQQICLSIKENIFANLLTFRERLTKGYLTIWYPNWLLTQWSTSISASRFLSSSSSLLVTAVESISSPVDVLFVGSPELFVVLVSLERRASFNCDSTLFSLAYREVSTMKDQKSVCIYLFVRLLSEKLASVIFVLLIAC